MKKQNYQLRIVITQGKEVLAEVKMRRDTLEDLPNVPSLPGTIYNMIGDLCRLQAASAETDEPTANGGDAEPEPARHRTCRRELRSYPWQRQRQHRRRNRNPKRCQQKQRQIRRCPPCPQRNTLPPPAPRAAKGCRLKKRSTTSPAKTAAVLLPYSDSTGTATP